MTPLLSKVSSHCCNLMVGLCVLAILSATGCEKIRENNQKKRGGPAASYESECMSFFGANSLSIFSTGGPDGFAKVYIEFPDGSRHFLPDLTEEVVAKNLDNPGSIMPNNPKTRYSDGYSRITFKEGTLQRIKLKAGLATWKIASKEKGPYLALPISKANLVRHFGEPDSWGIYVPPHAP